MSNIARQYGIVGKSHDPKLKGKGVVRVEVGEGGSKGSGGGGGRLLLQAELTAAQAEIERLRRELALLRGEKGVKARGEKPWEKQGISRQTYWRRQKQKQGVE